jgi:hypothetical protein
MERVATLVENLRKLVEQGAPPERMLITTQMLQAELQKLAASKTSPQTFKAAVIMPATIKINIQEPSTNQVNGSTAAPAKEERPTEPIQQPEPESPKIQEKTVEVLQVDESEVEAELAEIKRNAEVKNLMSSHASQAQLLNTEEHADDIPTLTHQRVTAPPPTPAIAPVAQTTKEVNDAASERPVSLNDRLKETRVELAEKLTDSPIRDLRKAIGINDRFLFINELFRGDEAMYERSIKTINNFSILPEAEYWIQRELKVKIGWSDQNDVVKQFDQLVRRRFA